MNSKVGLKPLMNKSKLKTNANWLMPLPSLNALRTAGKLLFVSLISVVALSGCNLLAVKKCQQYPMPEGKLMSPPKNEPLIPPEMKPPSASSNVKPLPTTQ